MSAWRPDLQAALEATDCLGAWSYEAAEDRAALAPALAPVLGLSPDAAARGVPLARVLAGIDPDDRLRIESALHAAGEAGGPFEAEFRSLGAAAAQRWLRLAGRAERDPADGAVRAWGLAFDLTEACAPGGSPVRRVNRLAGHAIAMKGLTADLSNPPLARLVDAVAVEIGYELGRRLRDVDGLPH